MGKRKLSRFSRPQARHCRFAIHSAAHSAIPRCLPAFIGIENGILGCVFMAFWAMSFIALVLSGLPALYIGFTGHWLQMGRVYAGAISA
jgi:hypothetical protein